MSEKYNNATAFHYASYRPPLHDMILDRVIYNEKFDNGLDIGCGTGYSTIALCNYCNKVYGIDPAPSMLDKTIPNNKIEYMSGKGSSIPLNNSSIDIVTLAGSLFYAKSKGLTKELIRICKTEALIIPYDFEIILDDILLKNGITQEKIESDYNHEINFSDDPNFIEQCVSKEMITLELYPVQLVHLLLANSNIYEAFALHLNQTNPYGVLLENLRSKKNIHQVSANIYYSKYKINNDY